MTNRQIKWVIKRQRIYDFFPSLEPSAWERDFISFWEKMPIDYKINQKLYLNTVMSENWGNVWQDIPGNDLDMSARYG